MSDAPTLILGEGSLAAGVDEVLRAAGRTVQWLRRPTDRELRRALAERPAAAVVISRDDFVALRTALLVEYVRPGIRLIVTIFDRTVAEQLIRTIPNCHVLSMADASVGAVLGPCVDPRLATLHRGSRWTGVVADGAEPRTLPYEHRPPHRLGRWLRRLRAQFRPYDRTSRLLLGSLVGLLLLVCAEAALALATSHESVLTAFYNAMKTTTTVGPSAVIEEGAAWHRLYGIITMAAALVLTAVFTAALVNRVLSRRLTGILGARAIPRSDHVIVVGLGQVGFRLCLELRKLGIEVVAVEQSANAVNVALARGMKVPVVIGRGGDRLVLERLSLGRARALAAVTSDELANIAISVTAIAVQPRLRTVLRAGSNEVTRETQALFPVGVAQDLDRIAATALAATAVGHDLVHAFMHDGVPYVQLADGAIVRFPAAA